MMHKKLKWRFTLLHLDESFDNMLWSQKAFKAFWSSLHFPFQQRDFPNKSFVCKFTCNLAKNLFQSLFLVKKTKQKTMKIDETMWAILGHNLF